jgi:uncharacterized protein (DUF1810 family)
VPPDDPFDLQRFVTAQQPVYEQVLKELKAGQKRAHWMWFIFPQLRGLGQSPAAKFYGITSIKEASAYLGHPLLGPRLTECTELVNAVEGRTAHGIFGSPDDIKFRSCVTLFSAAAPAEKVFHHALDKYFQGLADERTTAMLA